MDDSPPAPKSGRSIRSPAQLEVLAKARAKAREVIMAKKRERDALKNGQREPEPEEEPEEQPEPEPPVEDTEIVTEAEIKAPPPEIKAPPPPEPREPREPPPPKPPSPPPTPVREPSPPPAPKPRFEMIDGYWCRV
jgi:hypothetical protein